MFGLFNNKKVQKEMDLPFPVSLEQRDDGLIVAVCPSLPGCTAYGRSRAEALRNLGEAARHHLRQAGSADFEVVLEDPAHPNLNALAAFYGRLVGGSNKDGAFSSATGGFGTWQRAALAGAAPAPQASRRGEEEEEGEDLVDFTPQVYCLASFAGGGAPRLYAGTSASGGIYQSVDGINWEIAYATGEARVHSLAAFKNRLYAGTSATGKLFSFTGTHWSLVHRSPETALTALAEFNGDLYMGTYPGGQIYASPDGVAWHLAYDSRQTFVRAFCVFEGQLYAATSKAGGGMVFRTSDGVGWEKVFESRDPNFYCMTVFAKSLWLGTGGGGRLYRSHDGETFSLARLFEEEGVRALESFEGRLYAGTEGRGRLYRSTFAETLPPLISDLKVSEVSSQSALVTWKTDRPSDSLVLYGPGESFDSRVHLESLRTEHRVALSYLKSLTLYRLQAVSRGGDGSSAALSELLTFATGAADMAQVSSPTHPDTERWYSQPKALLSWTPPEGIARFHHCLDRAPDTLPLPGREGVASTQERSASFDGLADGEWWFHLLAEDRAGNTGTQAVHFRLRVDTQAPPPLLQSSSHPVESGWTSKARVEWAWEAPADLSGITGYYLCLDQQADTLPRPESATWTEEPRFSAELAQDGDWWLHVVSADQAGNVGRQAAHYRVRLDRRADPPTLQSSTHPDPERWVNSGQIQMSWVPPQDASGVAGTWILLDQRPDTVPNQHSGTFTLSTSASFSGKADGVWWFHAVTQDQAGNIGQEAAHYPIRIDTWASAPEVASPSHPSGEWVSSSRARFELTPPEDLSGIVGFYYVLDRDRQTLPGPERGTFTAERSIEVSGLADGIWTLHVACRDAAGNVGQQAAHCSVRIDTQALPPALHSPSHPANDEWSRQSTVEMAWEAPEDLSGVVSYFYLVDQEPDSVPTASSGTRTTENRLVMPPRADGVWFFHIVTQDRAGNVGRQAAHYKLRIDTTALPPRLFCPTHPERGAWSNHTRPRFEWFEPEDSSGIVGYYWCLDRSADTVPTPASGFYTTERAALVDKGLDGDGTWWFHLVSRDRAGNVGVEAAHYPVNIDTTANPPLLASPTHPDRHAWSNNPNPIFTWTPPEDHSGIVGYYFLLNHQQSSVPTEANGTWTDEPQASFTGLEDGVWTLHVVSKDRCGNVGLRAAHYSLRIDTKALPPVVSSPSHPEGSWVRNAAPTFTWAAPQDLSGVVGYYYCLDAEAFTVPSREAAQFTTGTLATLPKLEDGVWVFHIVTVDQAGNVGTQAAHYSVAIDSTAEPPLVHSSTHPDPDAWRNQPAPQFSWQPPSDPSGVAGYFYCVDQAPHTVPGQQATWTTETQVTLPHYPDGEWYFHIATRDGAGNLSQDAAHARFRIDTTVPTPRLFSKTHPSGDEWYGLSRPHLAWEDGDDLSGIQGHYWVLDRNPSTPILPSQAQFLEAGSITLPPQQDGIWWFHLAARDRAGNTSEPAHLCLRIETVPPTSRLEPLPALSRETTLALRWSGEDATSGVASFDLQVREGEEGAWQDLLEAATSRGTEFAAKDGRSYHFRVRARDKAGNLEPWDEQGPWPSTVVDITPPEPVKSLAAKPSAKGVALLTWAAVQDATSGVAFYRVYRSLQAGSLGSLISQDAVQSGCTFRDSGTGLADGQLAYYTVCPVDKAGNERQQGNLQVACVCDRTALPPSLSSPSHPDPKAWYRLTRVRVTLQAPADATGIAGWYTAVDQTPTTVPNEASGAYITDPAHEFGDLGSGTWYFHAVSKDRAGNVGREAAHLCINIDTTRPGAPVPRSTSHPQAEAWYGEADAEFAWNAPTDPAGIAGYWWCISADPQAMPDESTAAFTSEPKAQVKGLEDGAWWFAVLAKDCAGNLGDKAGHCRVQVTRTPPPPNLICSSHPRPDHAYPGSEASFQWSAPAFAQPVVAYHYVLDQEPDTIPGPKAPKTAEGSLRFKDLGDGTWWLHVASVDAQGRLGRMASHCRFTVKSRGSLVGMLTLVNGVAPLPGSQVELLREGQAVARTVSDKEGHLQFRDLPLGEYSLKVSWQPEMMLVEGLSLDQAETTLILSQEMGCLPNPSAGARRLRFYAWSKEGGVMTLKVYTEAGKVVHTAEMNAPAAAYQWVAWEMPESLPAGNYLYQATLKSPAGVLSRYPIRKLTISAKH